MSSVASSATSVLTSSATSVLIGHIASQTQFIRLGSGGIMLPNHSPLVIAEQFGTLATLYPNRIDLGLGRAPGGDQHVIRALRKDGPKAANYFPQDVVELIGLLAKPEDSPTLPFRAIPGEGTEVPVWILGSSLFGAQLAAQLGLPYAFASHFAPRQLFEAAETYRRGFKPSVKTKPNFISQHSSKPLSASLQISAVSFLHLSKIINCLQNCVPMSKLCSKAAR